MSAVQAELFDYSALPEGPRGVAALRAAEVKALARRSADDVIILGEKLAEVRSLLGPAPFARWLEAELGWSEATAARFINVAARFGAKRGELAAYAPSALYLLSAPSAPEAAREAAAALAASGGRVTAAAAREALDRAAGPRLPLPPAPPPAPLAQLALKQIRLDGDTQGRLALDGPTVGAYAAALEAGADLPPPDVFHDGRSYWLADGFHRWHAHRRLGRLAIVCRVHRGDAAAARRFAAGANAAHGLRRTADDERRAVALLLSSGPPGEWDDGRAAARCGVAPEVVREVRAALADAAAGGAPPAPRPRADAPAPPPPEYDRDEWAGRGTFREDEAGGLDGDEEALVRSQLDRLAAKWYRKCRLLGADPVEELRSRSPERKGA